jgi:hypothetical protein
MPLEQRAILGGAIVELDRCLETPPAGNHPGSRDDLTGVKALYYLVAS